MALLLEGRRQQGGRRRSGGREYRKLDSNAEEREMIYWVTVSQNFKRDIVILSNVVVST